MAKTYIAYILVYFCKVELIRSKGIPEKTLHKKVAEEKLEFDTCDSLAHKSKDLTWAKIHMETCKQGIFYRRDNVYKEKNIVFAFYTDVSKNQQEHYPKDTLIIPYNLSYGISYNNLYGIIYTSPQNLFPGAYTLKWTENCVF